MNNKKRKIKLIAIFILSFVFIILFILYGPWAAFRNFWITSAMRTMNHQYLAHIFYNDETIKKVMENNYIIEINEEIDTSLINNNQTDITEYSDIYEKRLLTKDEGNDLYKVINIQGSGYQGFLIAIYDPSKISLAVTRYLNDEGEYITELSDLYNAKVAINAGGFKGAGQGGNPSGSIVKDGKIIFNGTPRELYGGVIGFNYDNKLILSNDNMKNALKKYNLRDAVEFGPFLIVNNKPAFIKGNGGWGIAPRTAIGQRKDGIVLFLIIDGRRPGYSLGADMVELTKIMTNYKTVNAANLDGGASTGLTIEKVLKNKPASFSKAGQRKIPNAWIVTD